MPDPLAKSFYRRFREANTGWLRRISTVLIASILLLAVSAASAWLLVSIANGITAYRSPIAKYPPAGEQTDAIVPEVVLVVIDGLRTDAIGQMPTVQRLRDQGASTTIFVPFPAKQASLTTILSGATVEINDAPLIDPLPRNVRPIRPETLFTVARRAGLNTAIAGPQFLQGLIPSQFLDEMYFAADSDPAVADRRANDAARSFLDNFTPNILLVNYTLPANINRVAGATNDDYRLALNHTDQLLTQLVASIDFRRAVLIVTSSFGQTDTGRHGGTESEVTHVPLILRGMRIKPGTYDPIGQQDIAPTVASLVGGSIPSASQGSVPFGMLTIDDMQAATKALALAQEQRDLGIAYLGAVGGTLSDAALNDPPVARSSFEVKNYPSAFTLANLSVLQAQHDMSIARMSRIEKEQLGRAPIAILLIALPLLILWLRRSLRLFGTTVMAVGMVALFHWSYLYAHHTYSFSDIGPGDLVMRDNLQRLGLALLFGALLVIIFHWRDAKPSRLRVAFTYLQTCGIALFVCAIPFAPGYFVNGLSPEWYLGSLTWAFVQMFSLGLIAGFGVLAVPAAAATALVYWLALVIIHRILNLRWLGKLGLRLRNIPSSVTNLFQ